MESGHSESLIPQLREAEITLEHALAEACSAKPASKADTGELIRVEEVLAVATDAAKRAISLRRRRRAVGTMGDAEALATLGATHRNFTDARGIWWDVFAVYPETRPVPNVQLKGTYAQGWLCFDSGTEKRRLSPIPEDWRTVSEADLAKLAEQAEVATSWRKRTPRKQPGPEERPKPD